MDQWLVLKNLNENERLSQTELAHLVFKDHPTLTRIVDILCKKGYLERVQHPEDRRSYQLHLTQEERQGKRPKTSNCKHQAKGLGKSR